MNFTSFSKKQKIWFWSGVSFAGLIGLVVCLKAIFGADSGAGLATYQVKKEVYENVIEIAGTVSAAKSQTLKSLNDGNVVGVYKKEGDAVKEGDLIVQLDDTEQQYNLANLDYEISVAKQNQTGGKIRLMETQRKSLVQKVNNRKIVATFDGIIASLDVDPGDYLEAKDSIGTLVDTSYLTAEVEVAETDVSKLKVGQKVVFTFPAYSGTVEGYLVSFPAIGEVTSRGATIVNAKVRIDNVPDGVLPNFSFTGKIYITDPEEKLVVERLAIGYEKTAGGESVHSFVEVIEKNGKTQKVEVKVEPYSPNYVNIIEGLNGGELLKQQASGQRSGRMSTTTKGKKSSGSGNGGTSGAGFGPPPRF